MLQILGMLEIEFPTRITGLNKTPKLMQTKLCLVLRIKEKVLIFF